MATPVPSILVVDVGNSSTSLGLYRRGRVRRQVRFDTRLTHPAQIQRMVRRLGASTVWSGAMIATVVPTLGPLWRKTLRALVRGPVGVLDHRSKLGIAIRYPKPASIGPDRLANACAGVHRYGSPLIVADFGTAVTFDVITRTGGYEGGVIGPGLPLMFSYLAEKTARLPRLQPKSVRGGIGKSTEHAMQLGARWGYRGLVREVLTELMRQPSLRNARLVATGGYAPWVVRGMGLPMTVARDLTLEGVGRCFELTYGCGDVLK
jgi:type III pantothenate kinase